jgi:hypothetical protein
MTFWSLLPTARVSKSMGSDLLEAKHDPGSRIDNDSYSHSARLGIPWKRFSVWKKKESIVETDV